MNVQWSERAAEEFVATILYVVNKFGQFAAQKLRTRINDSINKISQFPEIGTITFTDDETGIEFHELQCGLNSVVYTIYNGEIYIVSIWSNRQNRDKLYSALKADAKDKS